MSAQPSYKRSMLLLNVRSYGLVLIVVLVLAALGSIFLEPRNISPWECWMYHQIAIFISGADISIPLCK
ncbi:MAG: hypothetical protein M3Q44_07875 [bacterium]|nr:hypothetical protein [bacterium]